MTNSTIETLDWLIEYWPDLVTARLPMVTRTPRPTNEISGDAQELIDAAAHLDRYFRNPLGVRESPAPLDVDILQTALDVLVAADDLAADLGPEALCPTLPPPAHGQLDARPWLAYARARLLDLDPAWQEWTSGRVARMYEQVALALGMRYIPCTVRVICPWCEGRTPVTPVGGAYTWRVEELPGAQIAIVCYGSCAPPEHVVGVWWAGRPCWPAAGWGKLAAHVAASGPRASGRVLLELRRALGLAGPGRAREEFAVGGRA